jgi:hypothetical protein
MIGIAMPVMMRSGSVYMALWNPCCSSPAWATTTPSWPKIPRPAEAFGGPGILVPVRNEALFQWCLAQGLRVVQEEMTLMTIGLYNEPAGAYLPSVLY